jgi:hypothetical protein
MDRAGNHEGSTDLTGVTFGVTFSLQNSKNSNGNIYGTLFDSCRGLLKHPKQSDKGQINQQ